MEVPIVSVGKIIEGAMDGDLEKVKSYSLFIAYKLEKQGELSAAKLIRSKLDGSYKYQNKVVIDENMP